MVPYDDEPTKDYPHHTEQTANPPATAHKVDDDDNLDEKDLKRSYLFGDSEDKNPDRKQYESHGMGGQSFGQDNVVRSGDDPANPSRNAGYDNDYFKRTEPLEEHPDNQNFKPTAQEGEPDPNMGKEEDVPGYREAPEQQKVGGVDPSQGGDHSAGSNANEQYQGGTADNDGNSNRNAQVDGELETKGTGIAGENNQSEDGQADYKPEDDEGKPDYGSHSPEEDGSKVTEGE